MLANIYYACASMQIKCKILLCSTKLCYNKENLVLYI